MNVFIDPAYKAYYENRLFDASNTVLNRDDTLMPFIRMRDALRAQNKTVTTADYLHSSQDLNLCGEYYSFGLLDNIDSLLRKKNIVLKAFVVFEPPVVAPELYMALPKLTRLFERVYVHNVIGDGYSLHNVEAHKLHKLYWPQPNDDVINRFWTRAPRLSRVVIINGNHKPRSRASELYSKRIDVMVELAKMGMVDLYGRGWKKWYSRASLWLPYWQNKRQILSIYKGPCDSKLDVLSQYDFCLCFENMQMHGYITEKLFDCLYAGTIPIYLGAQDISHFIPKEAYIDFRQYSSITELCNSLLTMTECDIQGYRQAGRLFLQSSAGMRFYNAIETIFDAQ